MSLDSRLVHADCVPFMKALPDNSIDCVVTDAPYGLAFMGLDWDKALPPKDAFIEMHRILKPGALAFVMCSARLDLMWRMGSMLEGSGLNAQQSFMAWIHKAALPKGLNISKAIDKKLGKLGDRETLGYYTIPSDSAAGNAGKEYSDMPIEGNVYRARLRETRRARITAPVSDEAKLWDGWYSISGLKPVLEPILMVYKPLSEKTIVDNVLRWGAGAINVDACRIPLIDGGWTRSTPYKDDFRGNRYNQPDNPKISFPPQEANELGRFPANLLVSDGALDTGEITKSGDMKPHHNLSKDKEGYMKRGVYGKLKRRGTRSW